MDQRPSLCTLLLAPLHQTPLSTQKSGVLKLYAGVPWSVNDLNQPGTPWNPSIMFNQPDPFTTNPSLFFKQTKKDTCVPPFFQQLSTSGKMLHISQGKDFEFWPINQLCAEAPFLNGTPRRMPSVLLVTLAGLLCMGTKTPDRFNPSPSTSVPKNFTQKETTRSLGPRPRSTARNRRPPCLPPAPFPAPAA